MHQFIPLQWQVVIATVIAIIVLLAGNPVAAVGFGLLAASLYEQMKDKGITFTFK